MKLLKHLYKYHKYNIIVVFLFLFMICSIPDSNYVNFRSDTKKLASNIGRTIAFNKIDMDDLAVGRVIDDPKEASESEVLGLKIYSNDTYEGSLFLPIMALTFVGLAIIITPIIIIRKIKKRIS